MEVVGRDVAEQVIDVRYEDLVWSVNEWALPLPHASSLRNDIYLWLQANSPAWPAEIAEALGKERTAVSERMRAMLADDTLVKDRSGYSVPGVDAQEHRVRRVSKTQETRETRETRS